MDTLGEKLRSARLEKGYTFDQIYRDTNIPKKYLEAMESEDFAQFPGEPYLLGFLRNYSEYLGLDSKDIISLYKTMKIQEQPVPMEQLLRDPKPFPLIPVIAAALVLVVIGVVTVIFMQKKPTANAESLAVRKAAEYQIASGSLEKRYYIGDATIVTIGGEKYRLEVKALTDKVILSSPGGDISAELGQEVPVDVTADGSADVKIFVADLVKNRSEKGTLLRIEVTGTAALTEHTSQGIQQGGSAEVGKPALTAAATEAGTAEDVAAPVRTNAPILINSPNPYPFTLQATFKGSCLLRWESDRKDRNEQYFQKADILNVQAQNGIRLWVSNASAVKFQVIGGGKTIDLEVGGPGEVVVTDLKWIKDDDGRYKLTTVRLD
ncbi:MAG: helix-turn-helix domain-containing protein [Termitinemataceae bacterium]